MQFEEISTLIKNAIPDAQVEVRNIKGGGDHFEVWVASRAFQGRSLVEQHQMVNRSLHAALEDGRIHALRIKTGTEMQKESDNDGLNVIE